MKELKPFGLWRLTVGREPILNPAVEHSCVLWIAMLDMFCLRINLIPAHKGRISVEQQRGHRPRLINGSMDPHFFTVAYA
jgi:hypothetical protein